MFQQNCQFSSPKIHNYQVRYVNLLFTLVQSDCLYFSEPLEGRAECLLRDVRLRALVPTNMNCTILQ